MKMTLNDQLKSQSGVVLIFGLLIMMVLGVVALTAAQTVVTHEKITGNNQDLAWAMQRAEDGLVEAEDAIEILESLPTPETLTGVVWALGEAGGASYEDMESSAWVKDLDQLWWETNANEHGGGHVRYFIEYVTNRRDNLTLNNDYSSQQAGNYFYRVTSRATRSQAGEGAAVIAQSIYAKRFE